VSCEGVKLDVPARTWPRTGKHSCARGAGRQQTEEAEEKTKGAARDADLGKLQRR